MSSIQQYQKRVFDGYLSIIDIDYAYTFPQGNPIRPLPPIHTARGGLMIVGAYPSAKFEKLKGVSGKYRNIPVANNLHPFANESYFDGTQIRELVSGRMIREFFLNPLNLCIEKCWITDLVKVFLYKKTHQSAILDVFPNFKVPVLRDHFLALGEKSVPLLLEEIDLASPKCIITLGHEVAQVVLNNRDTADTLLNLETRLYQRIPMVNCPHPDACRRWPKWQNILSKQISLIKKLLV